MKRFALDVELIATPKSVLASIPPDFAFPATLLQLDEAAQSAGGASQGDPRRLVQHAATALVDAFLRMPVEALRVQAPRLAFALPAGGQPDSSWPAHSHQLRFVLGGGLETLLAAALPHWQVLEAAPVDYLPAQQPTVLGEAPSGAMLSKRSAGGVVQRGIYRLPPLQELAAADVCDLALAAAPSGGGPPRPLQLQPLRSINAGRPPGNRIPSPASSFLLPCLLQSCTSAPAAAQLTRQPCCRCCRPAAAPPPACAAWPTAAWAL